MKLSNLLLIVVFIGGAQIAAAQRVAILAPDRSEESISYAEQLGATFDGKLKVLDNDLARAAYDSTTVESPFNLTTDEARRIGAAIGCDAFILVRAVDQPRVALGRRNYFESYAAVFVVSSRNGRLISFHLLSHEHAELSKAAKLLRGSVGTLSDTIAVSLRGQEMGAEEPPPIEEVPEAGSPLARNFRAPAPYRRIRPEYTEKAAFYEIAATVEALVDLNADGKIGKIVISRWAGFGLDESVEAAIRSMNWRPAMRDGKPLPMRFLLRYNFKKLDKDPPT